MHSNVTHWTGLDWNGLDLAGLDVDVDVDVDVIEAGDAIRILE
jgi:hypothetical protein